MVKIPTIDARPGMRLAKDIYLRDGRLMLLSGCIIKSRYLEKFESFKVPFIYVDEESSFQDASEQQVYSEAFNSIKEVLTTVRANGNVDVQTVKEAVNSIVYRIMNNETIFMHLMGIRDIDHYTFQHSIDVCIYSIITGRNLGMTRRELMELGIGAILHDIGKCRIPLEILLKPGKLTVDEFRIMKLHTLYGYEILMNTAGITRRIADIARQHHEKWNGTGYPTGLGSIEIDKMARIVTVSDIYDALTANRVYKKRDLPHEAAEYIMANSSVLLDPEVTESFIRNISIYPEGSIVLLNTGEIGSVLECSTLSLRPPVRVIAKSEGPPVLRPYIIDLAKNPTCFVVDLMA